ncbi:Annexin A7 [Echinococcus granulosus]|uniref:Annexin A7 n=1 Tax=Echinococcus granulosus TaxID=6210 RepID=W6UZJ3_ECHGR|nr:Annexin A7 [Echinococcus granulosus]EUB59084.1 Annexin A7 [Echinococcus granulosus]
MQTGATVLAAPYMDASEDANELEKAMKGIGTDEKKIINILANRTVQQRQEIARAYKAAYGKDLQGRLRRHLSGDIRRAVLCSFYDKAHVNARACYKSIRGPGTDEQILIDVICTSDNAEIYSLKRAYRDTVRHNLEADVKGDVRGDLEFVLVALLQGKRETAFNQAQVNKDAEALYSGGEKKLGTDESLFTRILVTRSFKSIRAINEAYKETSLAEIQRVFNIKYTRKNLREMVKDDTSGNYKKFLLAILGEK